MTLPPPGAVWQYGGPQEGIALTMQTALGGGAQFTPRVEIDGYVTAVPWGRSVLPVPPGRHHVHVHIPAPLQPRMGAADAVVDVYPGQVTELWYTLPALFGWRATLVPGVPGAAPPTRVGPRLILLGIPVLVLLVVLFAVFLMVVAL